jgi:hypothetical protein
MNTQLKARSMVVVLLAGTLLTACGSNANDDALVGSWIRMRDVIEMRDRYVFGGDGTFTFDENKPDDPQTEDHLTGTYAASDGVVTATVTDAVKPGPVRLTFSYQAGATQFSSAALRAAAGHTGIVGVWNGTRKLELLDGSASSPTGGDIEGEFRADGTYRWTVTPFDGTAATVAEGTWVAEEGDTFRLTAGSALVLTLLDNEALVDASRIWQRN